MQVDGPTGFTPAEPRSTPRTVANISSLLFRWPTCLPSHARSSSVGSEACCVPAPISLFQFVEFHNVEFARHHTQPDCAPGSDDFPDLKHHLQPGSQLAAKISSARIEQFTAEVRPSSAGTALRHAMIAAGASAVLRSPALALFSFEGSLLMT